MKPFFFFFYLLFIVFNSYSQVDNPAFFKKFDFQKVKEKVLEKKYYALTKKNIELDKRQVRVVKHIDNKYVIVHPKYNTVQRSLVKGELFEVNNNWKFSPNLSSLKEENNRRIKIVVKTINPDRFLKTIHQKIQEAKVNYAYKETFGLEVLENSLKKIAEIDDCVFIDIQQTPKEEAVPLQKLDFSINNITKLHNEFIGLEGEGMHVSVKELRFDAQDMDVRNRVVLLGNENNSEDISSHATTMATIIGGAGNNAHNSKGVAKKTSLSSSDFTSLLPDTNEVYKNNTMFVQNHSYGTEIESFYGVQANAYDQSVVDIPELLHVFSSGNFGEQTSEEGVYKGITGYANITGNFKMAKNILVVGGIDQEMNIVSRSSSGPAYDGRIKPELVAHAPDGTSDAAALVSGTATLLQQKYKEKKGMYPTAALVKSVLIAGTNDVGVKGIDFKSGYGNVNAYESVQIIENNQFINEGITNGESKEFTIEVPEFTKELKVALVWNDVPANVDDHKALVNDLDMELSKGTDSWLPWVLDSSASLEAIEKPATRGEDHLNNVEFITIENPMEGSYTVRIKSSAMKTTSQLFSIAYSYRKDTSFNWNYPKRSDKLPANDIKYLRWTNTLAKTIDKIEYSSNSIDWIAIENAINITDSYMQWNVPNFNGKVRLRALVNGVYHYSEEFVISKVIIPKVDFNCQETIQFSWEEIPNVTAYEVELLEDKFLYSYTTSTNTFIELSKNIFKTPLISVSPVFSNNKGVKGQTINYELQGVQCYYKNFLALLKNDEVVDVRLNLSTLTNVKSVVFEKIADGKTEMVQTFVAPVSEELFGEDREISGGETIYRARIILHNGTEVLTNEVLIDFPFKNTLKIYPNPVIASQGMFVYSKGDDIEMQLVDITGRIIYTDTIDKIRKTIPLEGIKSGLFFVRLIRNEKQIAIKKVIIKP